jgi:hypothetical protein
MDGRSRRSLVMVGYGVLVGAAIMVCLVLLGVLPD